MNTAPEKKPKTVKKGKEEEDEDEKPAKKVKSKEKKPVVEQEKSSKNVPKSECLSGKKNEISKKFLKII